MSGKPFLVFRCGLCAGQHDRVAAVFIHNGHPILVHDLKNTDWGGKPDASVENGVWSFPMEVDAEAGPRQWEGMKTSRSYDPVEFNCRRHGWWRTSLEWVRRDIDDARRGGSKKMILTRPPGERGKLDTDPIYRNRQMSQDDGE